MSLSNEKKAIDELLSSGIIREKTSEDMRLENAEFGKTIKGKALKQLNTIDGLIQETIERRKVNEAGEDVPASTVDKLIKTYAEIPMATAEEISKKLSKHDIHMSTDDIKERCIKLGLVGIPEKDAEIASLKGAPKKIGGNLGDVEITSLKGAPKKIGNSKEVEEGKKSEELDNILTDIAELPEDNSGDFDEEKLKQYVTAGVKLVGKEAFAKAMGERISGDEGWDNFYIRNISKHAGININKYIEFEDEIEEGSPAIEPSENPYMMKKEVAENRVVVTEAEPVEEPKSMKDLIDKSDVEPEDKSLTDQPADKSEPEITEPIEKPESGLGKTIENLFVLGIIKSGPQLKNFTADTVKDALMKQGMTAEEYEEVGKALFHLDSDEMLK